MLGDETAVQALLECSEPVLGPSSSGQAEALVKAARRGHVSVVSTLLAWREQQCRGNPAPAGWLLKSGKPAIAQAIKGAGFRHYREVIDRLSAFERSSGRTT